MTAKFIKVPGFRHTQRVSFVGGEGIVRSYKHEAGTWTYLVEMALGQYYVNILTLKVLLGTLFSL